MSKSITATSNVTPFRFEAREVRTMLIDDQPRFVANDVSAALLYSEASAMTRHLDEDEKGLSIVQTLGGGQEMLVINESGLYSAILRSRKAEAKRFKKWVTAEVLPAIRKQGRYEDVHGKMPIMVSDAIGVTELTALKGVMADKAKAVAPEKRISFLHTMHHRLHTRFNVPRTELIPHKDFADACNFIAAYSLSGEWLAAEKSGRPKILSHGHRVLGYLDPEGVERWSDIPQGAAVLTYEQFIDGLLVNCDIPVTTDEMFRFAQLAMANLQSRSQHSAALLKAARRA